MGNRSRTIELAHDAGPARLGELIHKAVRVAIERIVREELDAELGAAPYERAEVRHGYRNGTRHRTLAGPTGPLALTVPRATLFATGGEREWSSKVLPRYQRRLPELNEAIAGAYLAGTNTRRIKGALRPLLKAAPLSRGAQCRGWSALRRRVKTQGSLPTEAPRLCCSSAWSRAVRSGLRKLDGFEKIASVVSSHARVAA